MRVISITKDLPNRSCFLTSKNTTTPDNRTGYCSAKHGSVSSYSVISFPYQKEQGLRFYSLQKQISRAQSKAEKDRVNVKEK